MTLEDRITVYNRIQSTLVTELRKIRERSSGADPRPTLKSVFDSSNQTGAAGYAHRDLIANLAIVEGQVTPEEFNDMVNCAALQL